MSTQEETVTADQPTRFPHTRAEALRAWEEFRPRVAAYADSRNGVHPGHQAVSRLSPAIRRRLVTEYELIASILEGQSFWRVEKFIQEMIWRRYWKSWLELRPAVWSDYQADVTRLRGELAGRAELTLERFSLATLFDEITSQWRSVAEEGGMTFTSRCDPALGEVVSDKLKLRQIAGNLLSNAIKYRKPTRGGDVKISFSADGTTGWNLVVEDTGIGIAREDMQALFGEFNRIRPNSTVPGTGLGLAICKEFAELLGGQIEAHSEEKQGTRFEVRLPMHLETPPTA